MDTNQEQNMRLDSRVIDYERYMYPRGTQSELLVLVEGTDDISFWSKLFSSIASHYKAITISPLKSLPEHMRQVNNDGIELTASGKEALMQIEGLGTSKVVAVDADYDLVIDNYHKYTQRLRTDPFVIHTEYYSIENHLLTPYSLSRLPLWGRLSINEDEQYWEDLLSSHADSIRVELEDNLTRLSDHCNQDNQHIDYASLLNGQYDPLHYERGHELYTFVYTKVLETLQENLKKKERQIRQENQGYKVYQEIETFHSKLFGNNHSYSELIHESIFCSESLDMDDNSIKTICDNIINIVPERNFA